MNDSIIDSHQHFWRYDAVKHSWIDDEMAAIRRDFLPEHLLDVYEQNGVSGCIAVQADQTEAETNFLIDLAGKYDFIEAVVGWVDLRADNIRERLEYYAQFPDVKGFRHVLQGEAPEFMLQPNFLRGIAALKDFGFTYDILVFPHHLKAVLEFVEQFPEQPFVIDHLAKPYIKAGKIDEWRSDMEQVAEYDNVYCKISGMVTEADYKGWKKADFTPYMDVVLEAFGEKRIMFGSDWPVCLVAASYSDMLAIVKDYFSDYSKDEQADIFARNAATFYDL
jgi:L-fuconolactonase